MLWPLANLFAPVLCRHDVAWNSLFNGLILAMRCIEEKVGKNRQVSLLVRKTWWWVFYFTLHLTTCTVGSRGFCWICLCKIYFVAYGVYWNIGNFLLSFNILSFLLDGAEGPDYTETRHYTNTIHVAHIFTRTENRKTETRKTWRVTSSLTIYSFCSWPRDILVL